jgi:hypothetical protein
MNKIRFIILLITLLTLGSCSSSPTRADGRTSSGLSASARLRGEDIEYAMASIVAKLANAGVLSRESTVALGTEGMNQYTGLHNPLRHEISSWKALMSEMCTVTNNAAESDYSIKITLSGGTSDSNERSIFGTSPQGSRFNISFQLWKLTPDAPELVFATNEIIQETVQ